jgi:hypothetical protein
MSSGFLLRLKKPPSLIVVMRWLATPEGEDKDGKSVPQNPGRRR